MNFPDVYGNKVVYEDFTPVGTVNDLVVYDLQTGSRTIIHHPNAYSHSNAKIYGDNVVYQSYNIVSEVTGVYAYNLQTGVYTTLMEGASSPDIYKDDVVFIGPDGIYHYNLATSSLNRITMVASQKEYPAIYDNKVVWSDNRNQRRDIYMYDLSTKEESLLVEDQKYLGRIDIYGNRVVWGAGDPRFIYYIDF